MAAAVVCRIVGGGAVTLEICSRCFCVVEIFRNSRSARIILARSSSEVTGDLVHDCRFKTIESCSDSTGRMAPKY